MIEDCWVSWVVWTPALIGIMSMFLHDIWVSLKSRKQQERIRQLEAMIQPEADDVSEVPTPQDPQMRGTQ